ncbi:carboxymuconolactone decarboxylase family protein [Streptomyces sp. BE20]|uniref:carboxymuconolactone decarboxylase family protein n=1 Tax=Streptomyces sp. BE20 TaxID=3002525 RepID=UPI002E79FE23|nr:carboxymuconolactone decarboxylase family protein [Streptomyces sp. BE20]MEE1829211.1 carboxymuconolactone decarboxylase family protein [Streptomyces sp. BE20]
MTTNTNTNAAQTRTQDQPQDQDRTRTRTHEEHPPAGRLDYARTVPKVLRAMIALDAAAREGLAPALIELVHVRSSQLNGCAYGLDMHVKDARKAGESDERIYLLPVWHEAPEGVYSDRERAALALAEEITHIGGGVSDAVYGRAAALFEEKELAQLISLCFTINAWNRINVATRKAPGTR